MPSPGVTEQLVKDAIIDTVASRPADSVLSRVTDWISHDGDLGVVHTTITLRTDLQLVAAVDNAAKAGGAQIMAMPAGYIQIHRTRITGQLTSNVADLAATAGEIGLGIVVASGAVATLATATFESIMEGGVPPLANFVANTDLVVAAAGGVRTGLLGGFSTAIPVFLNLASTWADIAAAANVSARAGMKIEIWWSRIGN